MKTIALVFILLVFCLNNGWTQENLQDYNLAELDTLYKHNKDPKDRIAYALVMLQKGEEKFGTQDTSYAEIFNKLGWAHYKSNNLDKAQFYYQKAISIIEKKAIENITLADCYRRLGYISNKKKQLDNTKKAFAQSTKIVGNILGKEHLKYGEMLSRLGTTCNSMGDYSQAVQYYQQSLQIHKKVLGAEDPKCAQMLNNLGAACFNLGEYSKAEDSYNEALLIRKKVFGYKNINYITTLENLGALFSKIKNHKKAEQCFLQGLAIKKELIGEEHPLYSTSLGNLGILYLNMGEHSKAELYHTQALEIQKKVLGEEHPYYLGSLNNIGLVYIESGNYKKAETIYRQILKTRQKTIGKKHPNYAIALSNLSQVYTKRKEYSLAEKYQIEAFIIRKESLGLQNLNTIESLNNLSFITDRQSDYNSAWAYVLSAITSNSGLKLSNNITQNWVDSLLSADYISFSEINRSLQRIRTILHKQDHEGTKSQQILIGTLALKVLDRYKNDLSNENDKLRLLELSSSWVLTLTRLLDKEEEAAKILDFAEQNKSVLLLDASSIKQSYIKGLLPDSLVLQEKALQKKYSTIKGALAQKRPEKEQDSIRTILTDLSLEMDAFQKKVKQNHPKYASIKYQYETIRSHEIQNKLDDKTALLEYLIGDSVVYIFYVDKKEVILKEFWVGNEVLSKEIKSLHNALSDYKLLVANKDKAFQDYTESAYWFYKNLVAPVLKNRQGIENLVIIPDGELGHLPFDIFLSEQVTSQRVSYRDLAYLINDYNISYNYSATLWNENKKNSNRSNNSKILAVASNYNFKLDPSKETWRLPVERELRSLLYPLPAAREEVKVLSNNFNGHFALDDLASESKFKAIAKDYGVIHLAMHGLLNKKEKALSSLAFTEVSDSAENNFLYAYEISQMDLNADLVVLSACETGYGKFEQGNGITSLAQSFAYAGVPAMLVTLWHVNDYATAIVMQNFYTNLSNGMPKDLALRQAKLSFLASAEEEGSPPAFWSPFILIGNTDPITLNKKNDWFWVFFGGGLVMFLGLGFLWNRQKKER
jgi:CHAT domain-containing protein/tetratricopeptide (TPR) repeat protein